jgi:hypothetical protein
MAQGGTTLEVTNNSSAAIPVMITLGAGYGISNVNQLPASWNVTPYGTTVTKGSFTLPANGSVSFNSGTQSFSGNISFGPTFNNTGCGNAAANACYPNATVLAEFTLNMTGETVDISGVNGTNAALTINFKGQTSSNQWGDGQGNNNVTSIANAAIGSWKPVPGVYGWQGTTCTGNYNPPNPTGNCPAPVNRPTSSQLQTLNQCNIQRIGTAPTGGTVQVVFNSWTTPPPNNCN